ncbi:MAG: Acetyl-CoA decarbonylase/synthase complex subunit gamma [Methanoregula sp. PtaU1.Bin051]|nr:MAG: Acetyl-CoA decarbonylase/synthase complex subunit gamma [Methanoregula sp. PtaU1.Bin051]
MKIPRYKRLEIEWKHFAVGDATCERCGKTGEALKGAIDELRREFAPAGVKINLTETLLDKTRIAESNEIRMNGVLIEDLLSASVATTDCPSCGTLAGESTCCRAIEIGNDQYEDIPVWAIRKAAYRALGVAPPELESGTGIRETIRITDSTITPANRLDHFLARWGWDRDGHRVAPGLYRLGNPSPESPVFASANYTLSFDALRSALKGTDAWIIVLDTKGINVWCAAGKGIFGTEELIRSILSVGLDSVVSHRKIIVPQLGAPGISWPEVMRRSGFNVEYGPVHVRDLPEYLKTGKATVEMRRVQFTLKDRLVLVPIELVHAALPMVAVAAILWFLAGPVAALAAVSVVLAGTVLFPGLLPLIPTADLSTKGFILGGVVALPFAVSFGNNPALPLWANALAAGSALLLIPAVTAYLALNFTGSTPYTSRTGVRKEIFRYVPAMAVMAALGIVAGIVLGVSRLLGVI